MTSSSVATVPGMVSVVIPVYREVDNVEPLMEKVEAACTQMGCPFEIILVDDGSTDGTPQAIQALTTRYASLRPVYLRRNHGQSAALTAGFDAARGEYIATLDGDLQNDPQDLVTMLRMVQADQADVVCGWRVKRKDRSLDVKLPSLIANYVIRRMTGVYMHDYGCAVRVFRAPFARGLVLYGELHRFIPVLVHAMGARLSEIEVRHAPRLRGKSKYGINKAPRVVLDLLLMVFFQRFATRPIQFFGGWGLASLGVGFLMLAYLLGVKLLGYSVGGRPMLIIGVMAMLVGVILISIGLCAELVVRTYYESTGKKIYTTKPRP